MIGYRHILNVIHEARRGFWRRCWLTAVCGLRLLFLPAHLIPPLPGIFIKLGQHMASLVVLPKEWTSTMRPLQDQCEPTPYEALEQLFVMDMGAPISELFEDFDPNPIGVASLAQVHIGRHRKSGKRVAVKVGRL
jgi:predicted unusual protein kinase regulating ubiquinone biosynthesis (AarF/ABC1/UbiB family)